MQAVKLEDELHRELKIRAATDNTTVLALVHVFIRDGLDRLKRKEAKR